LLGAFDCAAPMLSSAFVNEDFDFYGKTLTGAKEIKPRWKRVIAKTDEELTVQAANLNRLVRGEALLNVVRAAA
jgi:predicted metalloendopeptidase